METKIRAVIDILLLMSFILVGLSGIFKFWVIPWNSPLQSFLGLTKPQWAFLHDWSGIAMVVLALSHVVLYWDVMVENIRCLLNKNK